MGVGGVGGALLLFGLGAWARRCCGREPGDTTARRAILVLGLGTDITEVARIQASLHRFGQQFLDRVYTPGEVAYCQSRRKSAAQSFAARFAAKEATAKALGTGISRGVTWRELEVIRDPGQAPRMLLHGRAAEIAGARGIDRLTLSLTHTGTLAMAVVIAEGNGRHTEG